MLRISHVNKIRSLWALAFLVWEVRTPAGNLTIAAICFRFTAVRLGITGSEAIYPPLVIALALFAKAPNADVFGFIHH